MHTIVTFSIAIPAFWIIYAYPVITAWRGGSTSDAVGKSWAMQVLFFAFVCVGVPAIARYFNEQLGRDLSMMVPDTPILVPVFLSGWLTPLIEFKIVNWIRAALVPRRELTDEE